MGSEGISFSEHIDELRRRVKLIFYAFLITFLVVVFFPGNPVQQAQNLGDYLTLAFLSHTLIASLLNTIATQILPSNYTLIAATGIGEAMEVYFIAAFVVTLAIDMPFIAYEAYKFIDPALSERERSLVYPFVTAASALFIAGLFFGYFVIARFLVLALGPFFAAAHIAYFVDAAAFYYVTFLVIGATGVSFTSPVFVYSLIKLNIVEADLFSRNRIVIWVVIWAVTGLFLTPDGGPLLDLVIFIPIVAMTEAAIFLGRRGKKEESRPRNAHRCRYCAAKMTSAATFCPNCGRSSA